MTAPIAPEPGIVRMDGQVLIVTDWRVSDPQIVAAALAATASGVDLSGWLTGCLRAGVAAVSVATAGADLARVEAAVTTLTATVGLQVDAAVDRLIGSVQAAVDPSGPLATSVTDQVTRLAVGVQGLLTGPDATVPARVRTEVRTVTDQALTEIQRALAAQAAAVTGTISGDRGALRAQVAAAVAGQHTEIQLALGELKAALALRQHAEVAETQRTGRGFTYEADVLAAIGAVAAAAGDGGATPTGGITGTAGTRKGDGVIDLVSAGPGLRIVVEAKDRTGNPLTVQGWRDELAAARHNRSAQVGIGITRPGLMPTPGQLVAVLGDRDLLVAHDPDNPASDLLVAVYLLGRLLATLASNPADDTVDLAGARRNATEMIEALTALDTVSRHAAAIQRAATAIVTVVHDVRDTITMRAEEIRTTLAA
jgi:hypothetical protein